MLFALPNFIPLGSFYSNHHAKVDSIPSLLSGCMKHDASKIGRKHEIIDAVQFDVAWDDFSLNFLAVKPDRR